MCAGCRDAYACVEQLLSTSEGWTLAHAPCCWWHCSPNHFPSSSWIQHHLQFFRIIIIDSSYVYAFRHHYGSMACDDDDPQWLFLRDSSFPWPFSLIEDDLLGLLWWPDGHHDRDEEELIMMAPWFWSILISPRIMHDQHGVFCFQSLPIKLLISIHHSD